MYDELINLYKQESTDVFKTISNSQINLFVRSILGAWRCEANVFVCGNGGNIAYVSNMVTDFNLHPFVSEDKSKPLDIKPRFKAFSLCDSTATITAILNDIGPNHIFAEQLRCFAKENDVLIAITGSGKSRNIMQAIDHANEIGMQTIVFTKVADSPCARMATLAIVVPGTSMFPGQTGGNNNNFHFEDCVSKISHIASGILKMKVQEYAAQKNG